MRDDPKRILELLDIIQAIWWRHPDLQLLQLLFNANPELNHQTEDDELLEALKREYL